jgi:cytochrome c553
MGSVRERPNKRVLRIRIVFLLLTTVAALDLCSGRATAAAIPDTLEQRLLACAACHGKQGEGGGRKNEVYPFLAGKPAGYLYNQLVNFRDRRRRYAVMNYMVSYFSDAYLHEIAAYYARLHAPYSPALRGVSKQTLAHGEALVTKGNPSINLPACVACHGEALTGMEPAIPGLLGLSPYYVGEQMGAWRSHNRAATEPDCMARIASLLAPEDISAIAAYLATQPPPSKPPASSTPATRLPMRCGSLTQR